MARDGSSLLLSSAGQSTSAKTFLVPLLDVSVVLSFVCVDKEIKGPGNA